MLAKEFITRIFERNDNGFSTDSVKPLLVQVPASNIKYEENKVYLRTPFKTEIKKGMMMDFCGVTYRISEVYKSKELHYFYSNLECEKL